MNLNSPQQRPTPPRKPQEIQALYRAVAIKVLDVENTLGCSKSHIEDLIFGRRDLTESQLAQVAQDKDAASVALGMYLLPNELFKDLRKLKCCKRTSYLVVGSNLLAKVAAWDPDAPSAAVRLKKSLLIYLQDLLARSAEGSSLSDVLENKGVCLQDGFKLMRLVNHGKLQLGVEDFLAVVDQSWMHPVWHFVTNNNKDIETRFASEISQINLTKSANSGSQSPKTLPPISWTKPSIAPIKISKPPTPPVRQLKIINSKFLRDLESDIPTLLLELAEARQFAVRICWLKRMLKAHTKSDTIYELEDKFKLQSGRLHRIVEVTSRSKLTCMSIEEVKSLTRQGYLLPKLGKFFLTNKDWTLFHKYCTTELQTPVTSAQEAEVDRTIDNYLVRSLGYKSPEHKIEHKRIFQYSEIPAEMRNFSTAQDISICLARHWGIFVSTSMFGRRQTAIKNVKNGKLHSFSETLHHDLLLQSAVELARDGVPIEKLFFVSSLKQREELFDLLVLRHNMVLYAENLKAAWEQATAFVIAENEIAKSSQKIYKLNITWDKELPIWLLDSRTQTVLINTYAVRAVAADFLGQDVSDFKPKMLVLQEIGTTRSANEEFKSMLEKRFGISVPLAEFTQPNTTFADLEQRIAGLIKSSLEAKGLRFESEPIRNTGTV